MEMDKEVKQQIIVDWQSVFPQFGIYSVSKLYRVVGCLIVGIELIKLPFTKEYRPHFVMYTLSEKDIKLCLSSPILIYEFYNENKKQCNIPYLKHKDYFDDIVRNICKKEYLFAENNIPLKRILTIFDDYTKKPPQNACLNSFIQAKIQENKLKVALYSDSEKAKDILSKIKKNSWDSEHFEQFGINVNSWIEKLEDMIIHKNDFLKQINVNKAEKKVMKLPYSEIIT